MFDAGQKVEHSSHFHPQSATTKGANGWAALLEAILKFIEKMTPKHYRPAVVLIVIGAAIMGVGLGLRGSQRQQRQLGHHGHDH